MTPADISGYLQIAIGIVGIVLTLANVRKLVPDIEYFSKGTGAPPELDNLSGFIRVLIVFLLLVLMIFLISFGFSVVLSQAYTSLGAKYPLLSSSMTILSLMALSITFTLAAYKNSFWVPGILGSLASGLLSLIAAVNLDISTFWTALIVSLIIFLFVGLITLVVRSGVLS